MSAAGRLVTKDDGTEIPIGSTLKNNDGTEFILKGWRRPHKASSSGRVFVSKVLKNIGERTEEVFERHLFPHVFGLKIVDHEFSDAPKPIEVIDEHGNVIGERFENVTSFD